jgi:hypothetical protein
VDFAGEQFWWYSGWGLLIDIKSFNIEDVHSNYVRDTYSLLAA